MVRFGVPISGYKIRGFSKGTISRMSDNGLEEVARYHQEMAMPPLRAKFHGIKNPNEAFLKLFRFSVILMKN